MQFTLDRISGPLNATPFVIHSESNSDIINCDLSTKYMEWIVFGIATGDDIFRSSGSTKIRDERLLLPQVESLIQGGGSKNVMMTALIGQRDDEYDVSLAFNRQLHSEKEGKAVVEVTREEYLNNAYSGTSSTRFLYNSGNLTLAGAQVNVTHGKTFNGWGTYDVEGKQIVTTPNIVSGIVKPLVEYPPYHTVLYEGRQYPQRNPALYIVFGLPTIPVKEFNSTRHFLYFKESASATLNVYKVD